MPNSFCRYLSNGYSFSRGKVGIRVFPCGLVKGSVHLDSATVDHRKNQIQFHKRMENNSRCAKCQAKTIVRFN